VAMLVDRGILDYNEKVSKYWPEFAQNGKENITVKMLLTHQAGLPVIDEPITLEIFANFENFSKIIAKQKPSWTPGHTSGYHALTYGEIVSMLIWKVTGKSVGQFLREEITSKLNAEYFIGLPAELEHRVSTIYPYPKSLTMTNVLPTVLGHYYFPDWIAPHKDQKMYEAFFNRSSLSHHAMFKNPPDYHGFYFHNFNKPELHRIEFPSANGIGTARGLGKIYAALARGGELNGVTLLSQKTLQKATQKAVSGIDMITKIELIKSTGGFLLFDFVSEGSFGFAGAGGSIAFADPKNKLSIAYFMNRMDEGFDATCALRLVRSFYESFHNNAKFE